MTRTATFNGSDTEPWIAHDTVDGEPINPVELNLPLSSGELDRLGEVRAADAFVTAVTTDGQRWLLLVRRRDGRGWALPGGKLDPGEDTIDAVTRELREEATLVLPGVPWSLAAPRYVYDSRNRRNVWFVTRVARAELAGLVWLPFVEGGDEPQATWARAGSPTQVREYLAARYGGTLFAAHEDVIDEYLA